MEGKNINIIYIAIGYDHVYMGVKNKKFRRVFANDIMAR